MFDKKFVLSVLPDAQILHGEFPHEIMVSIDTRTLSAGDIFVALSGSVADGHEFIKRALDKGAAGVIMNIDKRAILDTCDQALLKTKLVILVKDTYQALYKLAAAWRAQFTYPVIGITGSIGKTSTKETLSNIINLTGKPFIATPGNYSSLLGLSLSLLRMRDYHTVGIFEVGISKRGEMSQCADVLRPTIAAIIYVGHSHVEGLGSLADIAAEKRHIFKHFKTDSIGIINGDQSVLAHVGYMHPVLKFGIKSTNQLQARKIRVNSDHSDFILKIYHTKYQVRLASPHEGAIYHALAAASIARILGIDDATIVAGVSQPLAVAGRFQQLPLNAGNGMIINDCYNASPESIKASLLAVETIKTQAYKVAVLGDMLELGVDSAFWHRQIGRFLRKTPSIQELILVGTCVKETQSLVPAGITCSVVETVEGAIKRLRELHDRELLVLVKASRGMHLDRIVDTFAKKSTSFAGAKRLQNDALKKTGPDKHLHT